MEETNKLKSFIDHLVLIEDYKAIADMCRVMTYLGTKPAIQIVLFGTKSLRRHEAVERHRANLVNKYKEITNVPFS